MDVRATIRKHKKAMPILMLLGVLMVAMQPVNAAVNFTDAGATIQAVADDLITPIVNLVLKLIPLYVALVIIRMVRDILGGVGKGVAGGVTS